MGMVPVAVISYLCVLFLWVPAYRLLISEGLTSFRFAPVAGCVCGLAAILVSVVISSDRKPTVGDVSAAPIWELFIIGGVVGAAVGMVFWVIARPDLPPDEPRRR
jgi:hypothetical protein